MDITKQSIEILQFFTTHLTAGAFAHWVQGKHFEAMGLTTLGKKYADHYAEEMGWVEKFVTRINDLGGAVKIETQEGRALVADPVEYLEADLDIQQKGVPFLRECMQKVQADPITYDILKAYLEDEEEDLFWSQGQVELIALIGRQNWLLKQL